MVQQQALKISASSTTQPAPGLGLITSCNTNMHTPVTMSSDQIMYNANIPNGGSNIWYNNSSIGGNVMLNNLINYTTTTNATNVANNISDHPHHNHHHEAPEPSDHDSMTTSCNSSLSQQQLADNKALISSSSNLKPSHDHNDHNDHNTHNANKV